MKNFWRILFLMTLTTLIAFGCKNTNDPVNSRISLSTWKDGEAKKRILKLIEEVTKSNVPKEDRIAVFDFDGTIGCEKPDYMEVVVAMKQLCKLAQKDSTLFQKDSLYSMACAMNYDYINSRVYEAILTAFLGYNQDAYIDSVQSTTSKDLHPRFNKSYKQMYYQPMAELIQFLKKHQFTVYIVSGSEEGFLRGYCERYLYIPSEHIIGSTISLSYEYSDENSLSTFSRDSSYLKPMADGPGKAELIKNRIGKQPILAFGNTMGDYEMLGYATSSEYPSLGLFLVHNDPKEYVYYDKTLQEKAKNFNWVSVGMKENFKVIFPE